ncbi:MAG: hypothetical protein ABI477_21180 [Chryseolinea sp.]
MMSSDLRIVMSRTFYAIAMIAFGVQHILMDDFIAGRAPVWPQNLPGQMVWAYATGLILIMTGVAVIVDKKARVALLTTGVLILLWAALRNIYMLILNPEYGALLTNLFKSLGIGGGAFIVANTFQSVEFSSTSDAFVKMMSTIAFYFVGTFLLVGGVQHFIFVDFVKFLIPTWIPGSTFWTYFAGLALVAGGLGIITGIKRSLAALLSGIMIFIWVLVLHLPRAVQNQNQNEWTAVFEALAVSGILILISEASRRKVVGR